MLQNTDINIICQMLQEDVQSNELVISETTPHVYGKVMLVVTFDCSV
jgi:hypothetical protein